MELSGWERDRNRINIVVCCIILDRQWSYWGHWGQDTLEHRRFLCRDDFRLETLVTRSNH